MSPDRSPISQSVHVADQAAHDSGLPPLVIGGRRRVGEKVVTTTPATAKMPELTGGIRDGLAVFDHLFTVHTHDGDAL